MESQGKVVYFLRIKRKNDQTSQKTGFNSCKIETLARILCIMMWEITLHNRLF